MQWQNIFNCNWLFLSEQERNKFENIACNPCSLDMLVYIPPRIFHNSYNTFNGLITETSYTPIQIMLSTLSHEILLEVSFW